ncbi:MAG TPA: low temperature requirement protein A, partial [Myxococcota bacterium]|nr:low temperature requirement protein A [Myxococcota bacterium]
MRTLLRIGMTRDEFHAACDSLLGTYALKIGMPSASTDLVSIQVAEGDRLLCFLTDGTLSYVEYKGGIFMEGSEKAPPSGTAAPAPAAPHKAHHSAEEEERRTTFLELFFDLVLVFAITQLTSMLHDVPHHHPGHELAGWAHTGLLAAMIWWLWSQFAWLGTSVRLQHRLPQAVMLVLTGLMLVAAVMLPVALNPEVAIFGVAYALVKLGAVALYRIDTGGDHRHAAAVADYTRKASIAPLIVLAGSFLPPTPRIALWTLAVAVEIGGALLVGNSAFRISPTHFAERHALVLIIVLGEAVVALGGKAVASEMDLPTIGAFLGGFALIASLWWSYFGWTFGAAESWLKGHGRPFAPGDHGAVGRMARDAFTFGHFPIVTGVIAMAVALKDLAGAPLEPWHHEAQVAMAVGLILYLGGFVAVVLRGKGYLLVG